MWRTRTRESGEGKLDRAPNRLINHRAGLDYERSRSICRTSFPRESSAISICARSRGRGIYARRISRPLSRRLTPPRAADNDRVNRICGDIANLLANRALLFPPLFSLFFSPFPLAARQSLVTEVTAYKRRRRNISHRPFKLLLEQTARWHAKIRCKRATGEINGGAPRFNARIIT